MVSPSFLVNRFRLTSSIDLLYPPPKPTEEEKKVVVPVPAPNKEETFGMTEEEERELAELMDD